MRDSHVSLPLGHAAGRGAAMGLGKKDVDGGDGRATRCAPMG